MGKALKMARTALVVGRKGHSTPAGQKQRQGQKQKQQQQQQHKGKPGQRKQPFQNKSKEEKEESRDLPRTDALQPSLAPTAENDDTAMGDAPDTEPPPPSESHPSASAPPPNPLPIDPASKALLFGEGDLSFSLSLHTTHSFTNLTPTTYDPLPTLLSKYPQCTTTISTLTTPTPANPLNPIPTTHTILHSVDATRPPKSITKHSGTWDSIIFLFPHTGGLTKDRDRQIRANQELLLGFFKSSRKLIEPKKGSVVMATFTGEPYESWDIRGLARREGFRVRRSGAFPWEAFPGYHHARTLGNVKSSTGKNRGKGKGASENTTGDTTGTIERKGWKGEDRPARLWIFEVDDGKVLNAPKKKRKRNVPEEFDTDSEDESASASAEKNHPQRGKRKGKEDVEEKAVAESRQWFKSQMDKDKTSKSKRVKKGNDAAAAADDDDASGWKDGDVESQEAQFRAEDDE